MKYCFLLFSVLYLLACNNRGENEQPSVNKELITDTIQQQQPISGADPDRNFYLWRATPDYKKVKNNELAPGTLSAENLIKGLNAHYENVYLEKLSMSGDTIYTAINNATYLTEQMGTTGAEIYLADVVLNLTAVPGINYVNIQLKEGSHMQPGVWNAGDFKKYEEQKSSR